MQGFDSSTPTWDGHYPDPSLVRADVEAMVEAVHGSLVAAYGSLIEGLWVKGSTVKAWKTPLDYVPELSDIDIHYRPAGRERSDKLADLDLALALHADIARRFAESRPSPTHTPRPQFVSVPDLEKEAEYVPPPVNTVRTLHGADPPKPQPDPEAIRVTDAKRLVEAADPKALNKAIGDPVEHPGHHLFAGLRNLNWRLSPLGSRVLSLLGVDFETAWSANRTEVIRLLAVNGQSELARGYSSYYLAGWEFFLSRWRNQDAGREAFSAGVRALRAGADLALESGLAASQ